MILKADDLIQGMLKSFAIYSTGAMFNAIPLLLFKDPSLTPTHLPNSKMGILPRLLLSPAVSFSKRYTQKIPPL